MAVGHWGIAPSEFWKMTITEWWAIAQFHSRGVSSQGGFTADEMTRLREWADKAPDRTT